MKLWSVGYKIENNEKFSSLLEPLWGTLPKGNTLHFSIWAEFPENEINCTLVNQKN